MKARWLPLILGAGMGASSADRVLDHADAAAARGELARAIALYEGAEATCHDPGRLTIGLAQARYALAIQEPARRSALLTLAEADFRCLLDAENPRRAEALVGIGNCLLQKRPAPRSTEAALECYSAVMSTESAELGQVARHNLQRARLLLLQLPTSPAPPAEPPPTEGKDDPPPQSGNNAANSQDGNDTQTGSATATPPGTEHQPPDGEKEGSRPPGAGNLPPVPDRDGVPPLTSSDARAQLEAAAQRIRDEYNKHRRGSVKLPPPGVRDW